MQRQADVPRRPIAEALKDHASHHSHCSATMPLQVSGDPRRPSDVLRYKRPLPSGDEATDPLAYLALFLGLLALVLKARCCPLPARRCASSAPYPQPAPLEDLSALLALTESTRLVQVKAAAWASLYVALSCLANVKSSEADQRQVLSSVVFAVFGLFASYQRHLLPLR